MFLLVLNFNLFFKTDSFCYFCGNFDYRININQLEL